MSVEFEEKHMKKTLIGITAAAVLTIGGTGALLAKNNQHLFIAKGTETGIVGAFVLDANNNMWSEFDTSYAITSDIGTQAYCNVGPKWGTVTISKKAGTFCSVSFPEAKKGYEFWITLNIRGITSISWELSTDETICIDATEATDNNYSFITGRFPNDGNVSGATGTFDMGAYTTKEYRTYVCFKGVNIKELNFDVISLTVTYNSLYCENSLAENPNVQLD